MKFNFSEKTNNLNAGPAPLEKGSQFFSFGKKNGYRSTTPKAGRSRTGFTLIETLVAITVLVFAIAATFTAAQSGLTSAIESKNQVVGYYLAEEAVEYIRNARDSNSLYNMTTTINWLTGIARPGFGDFCSDGNYCNVDAVAHQIVSCGSSPGSCANLAQDRTSTDSTYGMYGLTSSPNQSTWTPTNFNRQIQIIVNPNGNEAEILVTVTWSVGSQPTQIYKIRESLFNWQS